MDVSTKIRDAVLGIGNVSLEEALALDSSRIDELDNIGYSPLHWAAELGYVDKANVLLRHGANLEIATRTERATPLFVAVAGRQEEMVSFLLEHGASAAVEDAEKWGLLHHAVNINIQRALLAANVDPNKEGHDNRTPLHIISTIPMQSTRPSFSFYHRHQRPNAFKDIAIRHGSPTVPSIELITELVQAGADCEARHNRGATPLLDAMDYANTEAMWQLYQLGARLDVVDDQGSGILETAAIINNPEVTSCLRAMMIQGFDPDRVIDEFTALDTLRGVALPPYDSVASRPTQLAVFTFYALITEMRNRNWESGRYLVTRRVLKSKGHLEKIRQWLGWQWQRLYDDDDFGNLAWDVGRDKWPEQYEVVNDSIDYDTAVLFGSSQEAGQGFGALE